MDDSERIEPCPWCRNQPRIAHEAHSVGDPRMWWGSCETDSCPMYSVVICHDNRDTLIQIWNSWRKYPEPLPLELTQYVDDGDED